MFDILVAGGWDLVGWLVFWFVLAIAAREWEIKSIMQGEIVTAASLRIARTACNVMINIYIVFVVFWILGITFIA